jgi:hypothetical protein
MNIDTERLATDRAYWGSAHALLIDIDTDRTAVANVTNPSMAGYAQ